MKKSRITVVLLIVLALVLASCSQDSAAGLGNIMGKMGNNVWGIKADLRKSEAAVEKVDTIDSAKKIQSTEAADELISTVKGFIGSDQNVEAFHSEMGKPAAIEASAFNTAVASISKKVETLSTSESASVENKQIAKSFEGVIDSFSQMDSSSLTKSDVVTLSLVNSLLEEVNSPTSSADDVAGKANDVLAVLKLTTGFSELNIIDDIDLSGIFASMSANKTNNKAVAREDASKLLLALGKTLEKIADLITSDDGFFNNSKYNRFHMEAKAIKLSYEVALRSTFSVDDDFGDIIDYILYTPNQRESSLDDLVMYICASISCYVDKVSSVWTLFLDEYLSPKTINAFGNNDMDYLKSTAKTALYSMIGKTETESLTTEDLIALVKQKMEISDDDKVAEGIITAVVKFSKSEISADDLTDTLTDLVSNGSQDTQLPKAVMDLFEGLAEAVSTIFDEIKVELKFFVGTSVRILADSGFDTIIGRIKAVADNITTILQQV